MDEKKLTVHDYITKDLTELVKHPDFSQHALRVVGRLMDLTTQEIEALDLSQLKGAKRHASH